MGQYNRESGTNGKNQFGITSEDMKDLRDHQKRKLNIKINIGRNDDHYALIENFPGLDAEMREDELRVMADQLVAAADELKVKNN